MLALGGAPDKIAAVAFRNDDVALASRIDSLREEVDEAKGRLAAEDAKQAPHPVVEWLLRPVVVLVVLTLSVMALLPLGHLAHQRASVKAVDELRPARIREAVRSKMALVSDRCVGSDRFAVVDLRVAVDPEGELLSADATAQVWLRGHAEPLKPAAAIVERCVVDNLPQTLEPGSKRIETEVALRLVSESGGAR